MLYAMLKRLKQLWKLSKIHDFDENGVLNVYADDIDNGLIHPLVTRRNILPKNYDEIIGDGKAEFLGVGSEEEWIEQERKDKGMDKWYNRLKNL